MATVEQNRSLSPMDLVGLLSVAIGSAALLVTVWAILRSDGSTLRTEFSAQLSELRAKVERILEHPDTPSMPQTNIAINIENQLSPVNSRVLPATAARFVRNTVSRAPMKLEVANSEGRGSFQSVPKSVTIVRLPGYENTPLTLRRNPASSDERGVPLRNSVGNVPDGTRNIPVAGVGHSPVGAAWFRVKCGGEVVCYQGVREGFISSCNTDFPDPLCSKP